MKKVLLAFLVVSVSAFANYAEQVSVQLASGARNVTLTNTGSAGGSTTLSFSCPTDSGGSIGSDLVRLTVSPIYVPPAAGTTYSGVADFGTISVNRQLGQQYYWKECVQSNGTPYSPPKISSPGAAYMLAKAGAAPCGGLGTLSMIEPGVVTTSPFPMPIEVFGQDCYVTRGQAALVSGPSRTNARVWMEIHSPGYKIKDKIDGKLDFEVNNGPWLHLTNANTDFNAADRLKAYSCPDNRSNLTDYFSWHSDCTQHWPIGGYAQTRSFILNLANGSIGSGDTLFSWAWRFNGTDSDVSGSRIIELFPIEAADHVITDIVCTSSVCVASSANNGFSVGDDVIMRDAPGQRMRFDGPQHITAVATNTFTFTACARSTGGSKLSSCLAPIDSKHYAPPVSRTGNNPIAYAARTLVAISSFTWPQPDPDTPPSNVDVTKGHNLFVYGNAAGTAGQFDQLVNPLLQRYDYTIHFAKCGDCHAPDGSDLKYHNYSNYSIRVRSNFHGLSDIQGDWIASYIRSLTLPAPLAARPWNPEWQTGPGMDRGTFRRADSTISGFTPTMTSIVLATTTGVQIAKMNVPSDPRDYIRPGDPLTVWGGSGGTAGLNATWTVTAVSSTQIWWTSTGSGVSDGTYTDSALIATMANDFSAGCGIDCVGTYGYDDWMESAAPGGSQALWAWSKRIEARNIIYPWQFADWNTMLPIIHPQDAIPAADYVHSNPYLFYQTCLAMTPGNFASYKATGNLGYCNDSTDNAQTQGSSSLFEKFKHWWVGNTEPTNANIPVIDNPPYQTNKFQLLQPLFGAYSAGADYHILRQSVHNAAMVANWTLAVPYMTLGLNIQRMTDLHGAPTAYGCYPPWGMGSKLFVFNVGSHKSQMFKNAIIDGMMSTFNYASNAWYDAALAINGGDCYDTGDSPVDDAYEFGYLGNTGGYEPSGFAFALTSRLITPQLGNQNSTFMYHGSGSQQGTDWTPVFNDNALAGAGAGVYQADDWYSAADRKTLADATLDNINGLFDGTHDHTFWEAVFANASPPQTNCDGDQAAAYAWNGNPNYKTCDTLALTATMAKMFQADATKLSTFLTNVKSISYWSGHDFDNDVADAATGDTPTVTGTSGSTGALTVTLSSGCRPVNNAAYSWVISSTGGETYETLLPSGGTCGNGGGGTLILPTVRAHTGTVTVRTSCSIIDPKPTYRDPTTGALYFRCDNMY